MADILIKGMEMPPNCFRCQLSYMRGERLFCTQTKGEVLRSKIDSDCPIVELPPHGDLIDARRISEQIDDIWDGRPLSPVGAKVLAIIDGATVIVPSNMEEQQP